MATPDRERRRQKLLLAVLSGVLTACVARAEESAVPDALAFFKEEQVSIAARRPEPARRTPGIVTIVTREKIANSGARDLIDVLLLVPGFYFGQDTQGVVGVGFRGNWGHEGKILMAIDGQPINELNYGTLQFGNQFPIDQIQRVEILRGPGSVVYGGFAELAVINVVTRSAADLRGAAATWNYGRMARALARNDVSLSGGGSLKNTPGLNGTLSGFFGRGNRSDGTYEDFSHKRVGLAGNNTLDPKLFNGSLNVNDLHLRAIYNDYHAGTIDGFGPVIPRDVQSFRAYWLEAKYDLRPVDGFLLVPQFNYTWQRPWWIANQTSPLYQDMTLERYTGGLTATYDAAPASLLGGVSAEEERARLNETSTVGLGLQRLLEGTKASVRYRNLALFGQAVYEGEFADLTLGARYEHHSKYGDSFVPRAAATKVIGPFHAKLLYSRAFRVPVVQNISVTPDIKPEKTTIWEAEVGWRFEQSSSLTLNVYDITMHDPIVFGSKVVGGTAVESYFNFDRTGTRGAELEYRFSRPRGYANASYSFATAAGKNTVDQYRVPGRSDVMLGAPVHKGTLAASVRTVGNLRVNPSAVLMGDRWAYTRSDAGGTPQVGRIPAALYLHLFFTYPDAWMRGLEIGAGVHNLFDRYDSFPQPYNGGHPPLPGPSREYSLRVSYSFAAP